MCVEASRSQRRKGVGDPWQFDRTKQILLRITVEEGGTDSLGALPRCCEGLCIVLYYYNYYYRYYSYRTLSWVASSWRRLGFTRMGRAVKRAKRA